MNEAMRVFVYGTLKRGYGNHGRLLGAAYCGPATVQGFDLYDLGAFPAATYGKGSIQGEVYEVDDSMMRKMDILEGYPAFYTRSITMTDFGPAWIYHFKTTDWATQTSEIMPGGVWPKEEIAL